MDRLLDRLRKLRADVEAWLGTLAQRERLMVVAAAFAVALFVVWLVAYRIGNGLSAREASIEQKTKVLSQVGKLAEGYRKRQVERQSLEARLKGSPVQLMSHISQTGATIGIQVNDLRPTGAAAEEGNLREESVEVSLVRIELQRVALLVQSLERGAGVVKVRRIRITTRSDDPMLVDATLVVSTYQLKS